MSQLEQIADTLNSGKMSDEQSKKFMREWKERIATWDFEECKLQFISAVVLSCSSTRLVSESFNRKMEFLKGEFHEKFKESGELEKWFEFIQNTHWGILIAINLERFEKQLYNQIKKKDSN